MANYTTLSNYDPNIYIIEIDDPVESGVSGADSKPNIDLGDNQSYFKKYHSALIIGTSSPSGNYGLNFDTNSSSKTLFYDSSSGSFWKWNGGTSWINITGNVVLNVNGVKVEHDTYSFSTLQYELGSSTGINPFVHITNENSNNQQIKINKLQAQIIDASSYSQMGVVDDDISLNSTITNELQNANSGFGIKHFDIDSSGDGIGTFTIGDTFIIGEPYTYAENKIRMAWNESLLSWEFNQELTDDTVAFSSSNAFIDGITIVQHYDIIISTQSGFDSIFNKTFLSGTTYISSDITGETVRTIYIKKGTYILSNFINIGNNIQIISQDEAIIKVNSLLTPLINIFNVTGENNNIKINFDGDGLSINTFISSNNNNIYDVFIKNTSIGNTIIDANNCIVDLKTENIIAAENVKNINNSIIIGNYEQKNTNTFTNCNNVCVRGIVNGLSTIGTGNFNF